MSNSADLSWVKMLNDIYRFGEEITVRGMKIRERVNYHSAVRMSAPLISHYGRKIGLRFAPAEAHWILSGDNRVATIEPYAPGISRFSNNGVFFDGAYGPRIVDQFGHVIHSLNKDLYSRQAVMTIWRPNIRDSKDVPCTVALQFIVRPDEHGFDAIHCIATMRSSDAWLGWPYDMFNFTCIAAAVAIEYGRMNNVLLRPGKTCINAGSQHIYEENFEAVENILLHSNNYPRILNPFEWSDYPTIEALKDDLIEFRDKQHPISNYFRERLKHDPSTIIRAAASMASTVGITEP